MTTSDIASSKRRSPNGKDSPPSSSGNPLAAFARSGSSITTTRKNDGGLLTKYFLLILFGFGVLSLIVNTRLAGIVGNNTSSLERYLEDSVNSFPKKTTTLRDEEEQEEDGSSGDDRAGESVKRNINHNKKKATNARPPPIERQQQELQENKKKKGMAARPPLIEREQQERHEQQQRDQDKKDFNPFNVEQEDSRLAGLDCKPFGGPDNELAEEMVYWEDIPQDQTWVSPFKSDTSPKYLTFEPDQGGWNNIRMGMVSATVRPQLECCCCCCYWLFLPWKTITWVS
jgi:hypothetical protein